MSLVTQGNTVRLSVLFKNLLGVPTDPTVVTFCIQRALPFPPDPEVVYVCDVNNQLVRDSAGAWHVDYTLPAGGTWRYRFEGTGAVQQADQSEFYCYPASPA